MANETHPFEVEHHSIDFIPESERHGSVRSLFTLWFSSNMQITTVVTGGLAVILGLPLVWALLAIVIGNLVGGIFMALHSAQGPRMGIPQMIQSRAQFGYYGAILPLVLVILLYIGFFASSQILGGQALSAWTGLPIALSIILVSAVCTVLAVYGYDLIHRFEGIVSALFAVGFLYLTIRLFTENSVSRVLSTSPFSFGPFLLVVSIAATWQITYGPYVADYSRYLARDTPISSSFWWTYTGSVLSSIWMMAFGSIAVAVAGTRFEDNSVHFVVELAGSGLSILIYLFIILGIIATNVLNLYGMFMTTTTTIAVGQRFRTSARNRLVFLLAAAVIGTGVSVLGQGNFITNYTNFLLFLLYFVIPWSAINLVDFYLLRHERYDIYSIFNPGGIYGRANWRALVAYAAAILLELPFVNTTLYSGPLVALLRGADIAWIVGLAVAAIVYYILMRRHISAQNEATSMSLDAEGTRRVI